MLPNEDVDANGQILTMPLRHPGQYYDAEVGTFYNYFRDYNPATGRYVESDPIGLQGGMNTYGYVYENPLIYFDFYGLSSRKGAPPPESPAQSSTSAAIDSAIKRGDIEQLKNLLPTANPAEEALINRALTPAGRLINASLKRVKGYPSELENKTYAEICGLTGEGGDIAVKAKKLKKLIEQTNRLMEKNK